MPLPVLRQGSVLTRASRDLVTAVMERASIALAISVTFYGIKSDSPFQLHSLLQASDPAESHLASALTRTSIMAESTWSMTPLPSAQSLTGVRDTRPALSLKEEHKSQALRCPQVSVSLSRITCGASSAQFSWARSNFPHKSPSPSVTVIHPLELTAMTYTSKEIDSLLQDLLQQNYRVRGLDLGHYTKSPSQV